LQNSAIKDLVDRALLIRQFRDRREGEQPRQIDPNQVDQEIVSVIQDRFGGDRSQFLEYLRGRNLTLRAYRQEVEETIIYRYMRAQERKVAGRSGAPAAEPAEKPIHLRIIQLTRSAGETDAALLERANVVLTRFRAGESFAQLARKFDQFVRQTRGGGTRPMRDGDWGWQGPSDLRPQFRDAVMALQKGEVSAPLVLPEGCFLIYAEDRR
jgi:peptidyl-prolyl cis-trans isomerase SurA